MGKDIGTRVNTVPTWDAAKPLESLKALRTFADQQAKEASDWYYRGKVRKKWLSVACRFLAILLTGLGGLIPVASLLVLDPSATEVERLRFQQWGYLSVGLAGLALGYDRFYGGSSGWMRYITTALAIDSLLEEFRLDWIRLEGELAAKTGDATVIAGAIDRIKAFIMAIRGQVEKETQAWVAEFQSTLTQLEKQTEEALQAARAQARKDVEAQVAARAAAADAEKPGRST